MKIAAALEKYPRIYMWRVGLMAQEDGKSDSTAEEEGHVPAELRADFVGFMRDILTEAGESEEMVDFLKTVNCRTLCTPFGNR